jgi:EmrB/QacA subfamily drug resistance transporter
MPNSTTSTPVAHIPTPTSPPDSIRTSTSPPTLTRTSATRTGTSPPDSPVSPAAPSEARPGTLFVLLAGVFITTLDVFIVNVAIPDTQAELHAGNSAMQWVVAGFGLALGSGLITAGRLGDMFGRRRLYVIGLSLFMLASLACGLAPNIGALLAGRVVQGAASAITLPQAMGIMNVVFTGARRTRAFTGYGLAMGLAAVFGQLIGGALIRADIADMGWRSIYLINVPVCLAAVVAARRIPESRSTVRTRLDLPGVALVITAIVAVVLPLVEGRAYGWPAWTWASFVAAAALIATFVTYQRRVHRKGGAPLIDPDLFRERAFAAGSLVSLVYLFANGSFFLVLALYLQDGHGLTPLASGGVFTALGAGYFATSMRAGRIAAKLGRQILALGMLLQITGFLLTALIATHIGPTGGIGWLVLGLIPIGAGMGLVIVPLAPLVLTAVQPRHAAAGSGVLSTAQQVGNAIGVALVGIVFYARLDGTPHGFAHAFAASLLLLGAFCAVAALLVQLLPGRPKADRKVKQTADL